MANKNNQKKLQFNQQIFPYLINFLNLVSKDDQGFAKIDPSHFSLVIGVILSSISNTIYKTNNKNSYDQKKFVQFLIDNSFLINQNHNSMNNNINYTIYPDMAKISILYLIFRILTNIGLDCINNNNQEAILFYCYIRKLLDFLLEIKNPNNNNDIITQNGYISQVAGISLTSVFDKTEDQVLNIINIKDSNEIKEILSKSFQ